MNYPTKESVDLGMKLVRIEPGGFSLDSLVEEAKLQIETFGSGKFVNLVNGVHQTMCHQAPFAGTCDLQLQLLAAIMAKMFVAGWQAGRQEIIDAELKRMANHA